jgi:D-alanyl-D-alanine dipeptidase
MLKRVAVVSFSVSLLLAGSLRAEDPLKQSSQLIVVTTADWSAVNGQLQRYQRAGNSGKWERVGDPVAITVGHTGLAWGLGALPTPPHPASDPVKHEGDGRSPAGIFQLGTAFGTADKPLPGLKLPYLPLTPTIECVDDSASIYYNSLVDRARVAPDWRSSEKMRDEMPYYQWGLAILHNSSNVTAQAGSCIFLHIWGKPGEGTVGCTAMAKPDLEAVMPWIDPRLHTLLVQLPAAEYKRLHKAWRLP